MKLFVASDIHGSAYYCEQMINAFEREGADQMILLGDLLYHGPRNDLPKEYNPKSVIAMLNPYKDKILCVRGNCDAEVDQMVLDFPIMADYALLSIKFHKLFITHGHIYNEDKLPAINSNDILLHGHTHIPACEKKQEYIYMNPGSISIPKNGTPHSYILIEDETFYWKNLEGEIYQTFCI